MPANKGYAGPVVVTTVALLAASVETVPYPRNTVTLPLLMMRYWLPPNVVDNACTGVGALVAAVKTTVLPVLVNALVLMIVHPLAKVCCLQQAMLGIADSRCLLGQKECKYHHLYG